MHLLRLLLHPVTLLLVAAVLFYLGLGIGLQKSATLAYVVWGVAVCVLLIVVARLLRIGLRP